MIYFVQRPDDGEIKIGTTVRLSSRLKQLEAQHGCALMLLGILDGGYAEEQALHSKFSRHRISGEWFEPDQEVLDLIGRECRPWDGSDEADTVDIRLRVNADLHERIRSAADRDGYSIAAFIRSAVVQDLRHRAREAGQKQSSLGLDSV